MRLPGLRSTSKRISRYNTQTNSISLEIMVSKLAPRCSISCCSPRTQPLMLLVRGKHSKSQSSNRWLERQRKDPYVGMAKDQGLPSRSSFKLQEINEFYYPNLLAKLDEKRRTKIQTTIQRTFIEPDALILDLGAAPGGWSLYASTQLQYNLGGAIVAVDLLSLDETLNANSSDITTKICANMHSNFQFIQGDFTMSHTRERILDAFIHYTDRTGDGSHDIVPRRPNLVLSDMASNFTGDSDTDAIRTMDLCERALAFAAGSACFDSSYTSSSTKENGQGILKKGGAFLCKFFSCGKENEADLMDASRRAFESIHILKPKSSRKESSEMYLLALDHQK